MRTVPEDLLNILTKQSTTDSEADALLRLFRQKRLDENAASERSTQLDVTIQDRDNCRRRMQICLAILDEQCMVNLDGIAAILWPEAVEEHRQQSEATSQWMETFGEPVTTDPTQVPTAPGQV